MAINSDDELFHRYLYDWHVNRGLAEQLLEVGQLPLSGTVAYDSSIHHTSRLTYVSRRTMRVRNTKTCFGSTMPEEKNIYLLPGL